MNALQPTPMLRNALLLDGLLSGVTGLLLVLAAGWLGAFLELPRLLLLVAGSALLPFAALLVWLSNRAEISRQAIWAVIAVNALWVIDSLLVLVIGWVSPLANTTPKRKSFQIWVNCQIRQTMMIGTDIGSRMRPKMVKKPAPSRRAARTSASGMLT